MWEGYPRIVSRSPAFASDPHAGSAGSAGSAGRSGGRRISGVVVGAVAFVLWTAFVWGNRIVNVLGGDESDRARIVSGALAGLMLVLAAGVLVVLIAEWRRSPASAPSMGRWEVLTLRTAVIVTVVVWLVRVPQIALGDHEAPFVIVHALLGVISVALAFPVAAMARSGSARGSARGTTGGHPD